MDHTSVRFPSVTLLIARLLGLAGGLVLDNGSRLWNFPTWLRILGITLVTIGMVINLLGLIEFHKIGSSTRLERPANSLIKRGIFSKIRNPLYLGQLLVYLGLAFALDSPWMLLLLVPIVALYHFVITREEEYLERRFGKGYLAYKSRVPRWL